MPTLEEQLQDLKACGIALAPDRTVDELLMSGTRANFEGEPFLPLLMVMGREVEAKPWGRRFSDDVWHFDTEAIDGPGAYVEIATRIQTLAGEALPLVGVRDHVDVEQGTAWLAFDLDGRTHFWNAVVEDDWVDWSIVQRFAALLAARGQGVRLYWLNTGGQDCLVGAASAEQLQELRRRTGLDFVWLE